MPDLMPPGFMVGNSFFGNFGSGGVIPMVGGNPSPTIPRSGGVTPMVNGVPTPSIGAPAPALPALAPGQSGTATLAGSASTGTSSTTGSRRTVVPSDWLGTANSGMQELLSEYGRARDAFDTTEYDAASRRQQSRDLALGMTAAQNAASEYVARTRQAGGVGAGAGLVKAQGIISAQDAAGKAEVERAKYDIAQREAAATHAGQIANLLAGLRSGYLSALAGQDTTGAGSEQNQGQQSSVSVSDRGSGGGGGGSGSWAGIIPNASGRASGLDPFQVNASTGQYSTPIDYRNPSGGWNVGNFGG